MINSHTLITPRHRKAIVEDLLLRREGFSALLELPGIGDRNEAVICTPLEYNEKMIISLLFCWR
jgi:hypothetical protein